jgi:hypothetical protein
MAIKVLERLLEREPRTPGWRYYLRDARIDRATALAGRGDYALAVQEAEMVAAKAEELYSGNLYNLACVYSHCAATAGRDAKLPLPERTKLQEHYGARALEYLRQAMAKGWRNLPLLKSDPDLDALRGREDFKKVVAEAEKKIKGEK